MRCLHAHLRTALPRLERDLETLPDLYHGQRLHDALVARLHRLPSPQFTADDNAVIALRSPSPRSLHYSPPPSPQRSDRRPISPPIDGGNHSPLERRLVPRDKAFTVSINNSPPAPSTSRDDAVADFVMQLQVTDQLVRFQALMAAEGCVWSGTETGWIYTWSTDGRQLRSFQVLALSIFVLSHI